MKRTFHSYQHQSVIHFFIPDSSSTDKFNTTYFKSYVMIYQSFSHYFTDNLHIQDILHRAYFLQYKSNRLVGREYTATSDAMLEQEQSLCMLRHRNVHDM